jgi:hypothetical protein
MGQGQVFYIFFHYVTPDPLWPKKHKKKKKAVQQSASPPPPAEDCDAEIVASQAKEG